MVDLPSEAEIGRNMTFIYLVAAARADATPEQIVELKAAVDQLEVPLAEGGVPMGDIARQVADIMGPGWLPADKWLDAIEAMIGRRLR